MTDIIQAQHEQLDSIAARFGQQSENNAEMANQLRQRIENIMGEGWTGKGSEAFYNEMENEVLPAIDRLINALRQGQNVTRQVSLILKQAEEEAASPFAGGRGYTPLGAGGPEADAGGASPTDTPGLGRTTTAGARARGGATGVGGDGLTLEQELMRDGLKAVDAAHKGAGVLAKILPAGVRVNRIVESLGFRGAGSAVGGIIAGMDAAERGVSSPATIVDGVAAGAIDFSGVFSSGRLGIASAIVGVVHSITSAISPEAGKYTAVVADVMPGQVAEKFAVGAIDTADALIRGDYDQLVKHHEQNLAGKYGEVIRGYAIGAEAVGALVTGDSRALNELSDAAASGELGPVAEFGDWLGGAVYDLFH